MQEEVKKYPTDYIHLEDMAMKTAAQYFGEELLGYLGVKEKPVRVVPTEIIQLEARQLYQDFNFEMENGWWYHFEFESDEITQGLNTYRVEIIRLKGEDADSLFEKTGKTGKNAARRYDPCAFEPFDGRQNGDKG